MQLSAEQKQLIEQIGIFHEQQGFQPVAGRIMGLLFVSDQPRLTFEEIMEILGISKSATSNALTLLQQMHSVEYTTFSGDRKRYFFACRDNWPQEVIRKMGEVLGLSKLLRKALELQKNATPEDKALLLERIEFMEFLSAEVPSLMEKWLKERKK